MNKKIIIAAVLFITILGAVSKFHGSKFLTAHNDGENVASYPPMVAGTNSLIVNNQAAGNSVTVSSVGLEKKGFVVIHEKDGELFGKIIGSSELLESGESGNVHVPLREPTQNGKKYIAVLVVDNGDGRYMPGSDHPVMNSAGDGGAFKTEFSVGAGDADMKNN